MGIYGKWRGIRSGIYRSEVQQALAAERAGSGVSLKGALDAETLSQELKHDREQKDCGKVHGRFQEKRPRADLVLPGR